MNRRDDYLAMLEQRDIFINHGCALYQCRRLEYFSAVINNFRSRFTIILVAVMGCFPGIMFYDYTMPIAYQNTNCIRGQCNTILLESNFLWNPDHHSLCLWLNVQRFFQGLVAEGSAYFWSLLAHARFIFLPAAVTLMDFHWPCPAEPFLIPVSCPTAYHSL